jgi:predicted O-linked N-acetylglucosamine transferase (SPINDLY family)
MTATDHRHWLAGREHAARRDWRAAARSFARATQAAPRDLLHWINLAQAERHAGALDRATAAARRAFELDPSHAVAGQMLGDCLAQQHRPAEAAEVYAALEAAGTQEPQAMLRHAAMLQKLHRPAQAVPVLLRALSLSPALVTGHALLADALREMGLKREAVECMRTVLALDADHLEALSHLSFEKRHLCDWSGLGDDVQRADSIVARAAAGRAPVRLTAVFGLLSLPLPPLRLRQAAEQETQALTAGIAPLPPVAVRSRGVDGGGPVTIGFVSFDFREHPVSQLLVELFERLDRRRFRLHLYDLGHDDGSALRRRVMAAADAFVGLSGLSDREAAERIRADGVDLLVDLMGYTRGHRVGILAHRPAPVQVNYLGYPGSMGAPFIDYLVGDPIVTPAAAAPLYREAIAQMPRCFQPNGRWRPRPEAAPMSRAEAGLPEDAFVMCAFNHTYKILPAAFDAWCGVLRELPRAVLWLRETNTQLHGNVQREAAARGVDASRIVFAGVLPYERHFARLALADVFVDTWPYNAHTTASDALWAGVPVVTLAQDSFASRVAASVLGAAGLAELAFDDVGDYGRAIRALALDAPRRQRYRSHLAGQRDRLPLFDSETYTRDFEALLHRMLERARAGLPPAPLLAAQALQEASA